MIDYRNRIGKPTIEVLFKQGLFSKDNSHQRREKKISYGRKSYLKI